MSRLGKLFRPTAARSSARRPRRVRPAVEPLEGRLVPAGVVTVATGPAGEVTLTGDGADNVVRIFRTAPGHFRIEGETGTTLGPGGATTADLTQLTALAFTGGNGNDDFTAINLGPLTSLSVDAGPGDNTFTGINLAVTGNLTLAGGTGSGNFRLDGLTTSVGGNLTITGTDLDVNLQADRTAVAGSLVVDAGGGGISVRGEGTGFAVGRGIDVNTGTGGQTRLILNEDALAVGALATGESVRFAGDGGVGLTAATLTLAGGVRMTVSSASLATGLALDGRALRVGKLPTGESIAVTGGKEVSLSGAAIALAGGIDFVPGGGAGGQLEVHGSAGTAAIGKLASGASIRFAGGSGQDTLTIDVSRLTLAGGIDFAAGDGTNRLTLAAPNGAAGVGGLPGGASIHYAGGAGKDDATLGYGTLALAGGIDFAAGDGINHLTFNAPTGVARVGLMATGASIQFTGGSGTDLLATGVGRLALAGGIDFAGGAGDNGIQLGSVGITAPPIRRALRGPGDQSIRAGKLPGGQSIRYTGGDGEDALTAVGADLALAGGIDFAPGGGDNAVQSQLNTLRTGTLATGQSIRYVGGGLSDTLQLAARRIGLPGSVEMAGGEGDNSLDLQARVIAMGKTAGGESVRYAGGAGTDAVQFDGSATLAGSLTVGGGAGNDTLTLHGPRLQVGGAVTFDGGAGNDRFTADTPALALGGGLAFAGGTGSNDFTLTADGTIAGDVTLDFGPAAATESQDVELRGGSGLVNGLAIRGALAVTAAGAAGSSELVVLQDVSVARAVAIALGDGVSNVLIDNLFAGAALTVDTNGGNDTVDVERLGLFGTSVVAGAATIRTGDGADTVRIGTGTADGRVRFLGGLTLDGGNGVDTRNAIDTANAFHGGEPTGLDTFETVVV
jgi:hypothetical protein